MKINTLIVDDNELDRYILKRWLKSCSFDANITEANDGQSALEYFTQASTTEADGYPPDVIFLDINMPRLNGFEFLEQFARIREQETLSSTVIVMFTSSPRQDDKDRADQWDFVEGFLVKGEFASEEIEDLIARQRDRPLKVIDLTTKTAGTPPLGTGP